MSAKAKVKEQEPYIRIIVRRIAGAGVQGAQTEFDAMKEICAKYPAPDWCLASSHYVGLEPGPIIDVMLVFVKAEHYIPGGAMFYLSEIAESLSALGQLEEGDEPEVVELPAE